LHSLGFDEGRKRMIGIMAAILTSLHMDTAEPVRNPVPAQTN
jgi:hypothetical protein